ncbi:MAG TPA: copper-translocating P-type ATPase [Burkholderiales bacterium]|nr:copper-translocating P-type ATPase [Burkholderiales bacterium]
MTIITATITTAKANTMNDDHIIHHRGLHDAASARAAQIGNRHAGHDHAGMVAAFRRRFWISLVLTLPILLLSPAGGHGLGLIGAIVFPGSRLVLLALSSAVYFYGGWPFLAGLLTELKQRQPGMMTLISLAISVAYVYSVAVVLSLHANVLFWELATLIDIMLLGHWIEMKSVMGASGALKALVELLPATAHRLAADGGQADVAVSDLQPGDRVLVKPGERVPSDGRIVEGRTSLNESMLTGESRPAARGPGEQVIGGSVNGEGAITVLVAKTGKDTYLSEVVDMVSRAQASRSRTQDLANRAALWLTLIAVGAGSLTLAVWMFSDRGLAFAIERMVTVMVIACPHALGLAVPLVVAVSSTLAARSGLLIRDRAAFERGRELQAVVFDKTGTLTEGRFGVTDVVRLVEVNEQEVLRLAAALESQSEHPIARGIVHRAEELSLPIERVTDFHNIMGGGALARMGQDEIAVVGPGYLDQHGIQIEDRRLVGLMAQSKTVVYVLRNGEPLGAVALADVVRPESREAVAKLKAMGIRCMMLTGDNRAVAEAVAKELGLDEYFAEVPPEGKADKIREVKSRSLTVAMVGDGVNDAPALVESDLGIAVGAGTNVAIESADVVLVRSNPLDVAAILGLSRATYRKMVQNLWWATGYNAVAIPLAAGLTAGLGFFLSPAVGAVFMAASTVIVAVNAKLLERIGSRSTGRR